MKKWKQKMYAWILFLAIFVTTVNPGMLVRAEESAGISHGLTGDWFNVRDNADISEFEFTADKEYLGSTEVRNFERTDFKSTIAELIGNDNDVQYVMARFTGQIDIPETGDYTFYMVGDDGFRLFIDNTPVIEFWEKQWNHEKTGSISLDEGRHSIRVEYLQGHGDAWLSLQWSSDSIDKSYVPNDALYQTQENSFNGAMRTLEKELAAAQAALTNVEGLAEEKAVLKEQIDAAVVLSKIEYNEENVDADVLKLNQALEALKAAKLNYYRSTGVQEKSVHTQFTNPLYQGQDPFVTQKDGYYYLASTSNANGEGRIYVSRSRTLTDQGEEKCVMAFTERIQHTTSFSPDANDKQNTIYAPEMFFFDDNEGGHWYIVYCGTVLNYERDYPEMAKAHPMGATKHVTCCIRSMTSDPMGEWQDLGPLYCGDNGVIKGANDFTLVEYGDKVYGMWGTLGEDINALCVVEVNIPKDPNMENPAEDAKALITNDRDYLPVLSGEGPRALFNKNGDLFLTSSEGIFHSDGYNLAILCYTGTPDLGIEGLKDKDNWYIKKQQFVSTSSVSGPARASFVKSADGTEDWMVYHHRVYKDREDNGWRQVSIQKFGWNEDGTPDFGTPLSTNKKYALPSGDPGQGDMYQAENAIIEGEATIDDSSANYFGDGYAHVPNTTDSAVSFVVDAKEAGDYIVGLRYAYGEMESGTTYESMPYKQVPTRAVMNVSVNGEFVEQIELDKTYYSWTEWFTASKRLNLTQGNNLITYSVEDGCRGNVHLDALTMYKADVPYTQTLPVVDTTVMPETISIQQNKFAVLGIGEQAQIQAAVAPAEATNKKLVYESSNTAVAIVDASGKITATGIGRAVVKITASGNKKVTQKFDVIVQKKEVVKEEVKQSAVLPVYVELNEEEVALVVGKSTTLTAKIYPANAANTSVSFVSSDETVAAVDASGNIVAKAPGKAVITATADGDKNVQQVCTVTVSPDEVKWDKVSRKKNGAITLKWKKQAGVTGYLIYRSEKKNGTYKLIKTVDGASKVSYVDKKAKKKKTYYYKICSYTKLGSEKLVSDLSSVKTVKKK